MENKNEMPAIKPCAPHQVDERQEDIKCETCLNEKICNEKKQCSFCSLYINKHNHNRVDNNYDKCLVEYREALKEWRDTNRSTKQQPQGFIKPTREQFIYEYVIARANTNSGGLDGLGAAQEANRAYNYMFGEDKK
jgi:hypothetical protein